MASSGSLFHQAALIGVIKTEWCSFPPNVLKRTMFSFIRSSASFWQVLTCQLVLTLVQIHSADSFLTTVPQILPKRFHHTDAISSLLRLYQPATSTVSWTSHIWQNTHYFSSELKASVLYLLAKTKYNTEHNGKVYFQWNMRGQKYCLNMTIVHNWFF